MLSPLPADHVEPIVVKEMLADGLVRYEADPSSWHSADGLPYGYYILSAHRGNEPEWVQAVEQATGQTMRTDIQIHIFVSAVSGRPTLGRIAERVARQTEGWVFVEFSEAYSDDLLAHLSAIGRCIPVDLDMAFLDADAMSAWNVHPRFHVIK